jgi:hypothetical protein
MTSPRTVSIIPSAAALVESLRGLGYSTETALADLIDNCIAAQADHIEIDMQWHDGAPVIAILDNGRGMPGSALADALCFGGKGPTCERADNDLGRFGLGLKTASLSQCRHMTIASRQENETAALALDIDLIAQEGWVAVVCDVLPQHMFVERLESRPQGTLVLWENIDERSGLTGLDRESFFLRLQEVRDHLSMVFHRFLNGDARKLSIDINGRPLKAWDPFLKSHPSTTPMRTERMRHANSVLTVTPWVLPHRDRFANDQEYVAAGGPGGWGARQGFYIYRGKRLLVAGSWLGLGGARTWTRDEASRLARIEINLPTDMDNDWRIDVRKSQARPPGSLRPRLTAIAGSCREKAREVFAWRGRRASPERAGRQTEAIWLARHTDSGTVYAINRKHPVVESVLAMSPRQRKPVEGLLSVIERSVPVERIWLDVAQSEGAPLPVTSDVDLTRLAEQLVSLASLLPPELSSAERADMLVAGLPQNHSELRDRLISTLEARAHD